MQQILSMLQQSFLGRAVETQALETLLGTPGVQTATYEKGAVIYDRTHTRRSLGLVVSGEAEITKPQPQGAAVLMNMLGPGGWFGAASMFQSEAYYVTDIRATKRCTVLFLPQEALVDLFAVSRQAMVNYMTFLTGRIYYLNRKIDAVTAGSAEERLALYLLDAQRGQNGESEVVLPVGMNRIAALLGIGRASLYRAVETLEQKGAIRREGKCISILRPQALLHDHGAQATREDHEHDKR